MIYDGVFLSYGDLNATAVVTQAVVIAHVPSSCDKNNLTFEISDPDLPILYSFCGSLTVFAIITAGPK